MTRQRIIVTGGFGALGRCVAQAFAEQGHAVARVDFAKSAPDENVAGIDLPGVDLADSVACEGAVAKVVQTFGGVDVLINIAGGFAWETVADGSAATWHRLFSTNVLTALNMSKSALAALRGAPAGRIVNVGAGAGLNAGKGMGAYAASKSGVHRLTESLAVELAGSAVTVNAILPSIIDTAANRAQMPEADTSTWVKPEAIADVILFLASPGSRAISGALIPVTCGCAR